MDDKLGFLYSPISTELKGKEKLSREEVIIFYLLKALKNEIRKNNFHQLTYQNITKQVTDEEFEEAIEKNPDRYVLRPKEEIRDKDDVLIISEITEEIRPLFEDCEVTHDEVAHMFDIEHIYFETIVKEYLK